VYCDHCQTTVVDDAAFCPSCNGTLSDPAGSDAVDLSQAPTVALTVGPCESCGAPSLPGSTLCLPCTRAFESILNTPMAAPMVAPIVAAPVEAADAETLLQPTPPMLPSAPDAVASADAATVMMAAVDLSAVEPDLDEPLLDDEEYEDDADEPLVDEAATVLATAPLAAAIPAATDTMDWSTPATSSGEHKTIVALPAWARKGPEADVDPAAAGAPPTDAPAAEPVPWWERNGQPSPAAVKPEVVRYVPPPSATPPASASLESTLARQAMRPKSAPVLIAAPNVPRPPAARSRTMLVVAAVAGVAAIGTPVMWKLAFASRPTTVSMLPADPVASAEPVTPRPERVHGTPAPAPAPAPAARVYDDLQPIAPEPVATAAPVAAAAAPPARPAAPKPAAKKPAVVAVTPEPIAAPVVAPEPAPLLVATAPVVATTAAVAAPPPASVQAEAVPLGQIFEVSQVESRPSVTTRFDPVLPARIGGAAPVVVIVRVLVSASGRAVEAAPVKNPTNDTGVGAAAAATVRQWSFTAAKKKGQPVSCWFNVGVVFKAPSGN
jgi:TonB family protein